MCETVVIVLDEQDTDRLLRILYNGKRPSKVHTLACACSVIADLRLSPRAWNGWQVLPTAKCPTCLQKPAQESALESDYDGPARGRFEDMIQDFLKGEFYEA